MSQIFLESERVVLRFFTEDDTELLFDLDSDPRVTKYIRNGEPSSKEHIESVLKTILGYYEKYNHKFGLWAAIEKKSGNFMGWFLLRPDKIFPDKTDELELGYRLKHEYWGQGYATEVSKLLVDTAFDKFNAKFIFATAMIKNEASLNVMKKLGFKFHSHYIEDQFPGTDKSAVRYVLTRPDWLKTLLPE